MTGDKGLYYIYVSEQLKGAAFGVQNYMIASLFFVVSDAILGYSKFVDKANRTSIILGTYFIALFFFMLSAI